MTIKTWSRDMGRLGINPDQAGLVAGYDMIPRADGTIEDKSGNGNHGTINGPAFEFTEIGPSMKFDGVDDYVDCGAGFQALTDLTVSFWVSPRDVIAVSGYLFNYYLSVNDEWGVRLSPSIADHVMIEIYDSIDAAAAALYSTDVRIGSAVHVVAQMDGLENKLYLNSDLVGSGINSSDYWNSFAGNLYMGALRDNIRFGQCSLSNVKAYSRALTQAEITAEYLQGAKAVNWKSDYGVTESVAAEATPGELSNSPARIISGTHKIATDTINGCSAKAVECVTAGVVVIPTAYFFGNDTQAAHGGFEWWMLKSAGGGTTPKVGFIGSSATNLNDALFLGYEFRYTNDDFTLLRRSDGGGSGANLSKPVLSNVTPGVFYRCGITRTLSGEFTSYLNGTLIDVTGGSGTTNPVTDATYTASKYIVLDLDAGDKVAWASANGDCAITKYQGVV